MKKRIWCVGLALFWYTLCVWGQEMDLFEQIALQQVSEDVGLEKNPPIQLPEHPVGIPGNLQEFRSPVQKQAHLCQNDIKIDPPPEGTKELHLTCRPGTAGRPWTGKARQVTFLADELTHAVPFFEKFTKKVLVFHSDNFLGVLLNVSAGILYRK